VDGLLLDLQAWAWRTTCRHGRPSHPHRATQRLLVWVIASG